MLFEILEEMRRLSDLVDQCWSNLESGFKFKSLLNSDKFHHQGGNMIHQHCFQETLENANGDFRWIGANVPGSSFEVLEFRAWLKGQEAAKWGLHWNPHCGGGSAQYNDPQNWISNCGKSSKAIFNLVPWKLSVASRNIHITKINGEKRTTGWSGCCSRRCGARG